MPLVDWANVLGAPFAATLLIVFVHGPMGREVLQRGIIFIDLAIAQVAGLVVVFVGLILHDPNWLFLQCTALLGALSIALFFRWIEKHSPTEQEAVIGCTFILAASAIFLILSDHPHGGEKIKHILSGQILFITVSDLALFGPIFVGGILLWLLIREVRKGIYFFLIFSVVVTASVQLVGVYVVFASLILPALAVQKLSMDRDIAAIIVGGVSAVSGITTSVFLDLPTGPCLVFAFAICALCVRFFHRNHKQI